MGYQSDIKTHVFQFLSWSHILGDKSDKKYISNKSCHSVLENDGPDPFIIIISHTFVGIGSVSTQPSVFSRKFGPLKYGIN